MTRKSRNPKWRATITEE